MKYPVEDIHTLPVEEAIKNLETDVAKGLAASAVDQRKKEFGANKYEPQKQKSIFVMLLLQFKSPIVYLLVVGSAVSLYFKDYPEAIAIAAVILINALIGFFMELQARLSMKSLQEMDVMESRVIRDGKETKIPSEEIVPGDIILLEAGEVVPADGRLIEVTQLKNDESSLTGESVPSEKNTKPLDKETALGDRHNMVFKGSSVVNGKAKVVISGIGKDTELGNITSMVETADDTATPLDKKLNALSKNLIWVTLGMTVVFVVTGIIQQKKAVLIIETAIALAVAAIPEGLPIVATVALAYGMLLMAKRNAIVKKLSAVETLGSTNVILTDKTGTLTENKIHVQILSFPDENKKVKIENQKLTFEDGEPEKSKENFEKIKLIAALCNDAGVKKEGDKEKETGDPIEIALNHMVDGTDKKTEEIKKQYPRTDEVPFSSELKMMATINKSPENSFVAVKGSVEHVLEKCNNLLKDNATNGMSEEDKKKLLEESETMAADGLRVLAFAYKEGEATKDNALSDLTFAGMIGFLDPPRLDVKDAILSCRKAGIKVVMITGDHPKTALNIARQTGLIEENDEKVIVGKDLPDPISDDWKQRIMETAVFARTTPKQKLDIAEVFQKDKNIVAMTGDGVNDAPALKKADVGIAMGQRGTSVAKETASIVLKDDSFASIAEAVRHGREIFKNIKKFVVYLVSCNMSEILVVTTLGFLAPAATLLPLQILFLNMVTDIFPALALGVGKGEEKVMDEPPRRESDAIVGKKDWITVTIYAAAMTLAVVLAVVYSKYVLDASEHDLNNIAFVTLTITQLLHVFNMSSLKSSVFVNEVTRNHFVWLALLLCFGLLALVFVVPSLRSILELELIPISQWITCFVASCLPLVGLQIYHYFGRKKIHSTQAH